jgi:hypothetical protein
MYIYQLGWRHNGQVSNSIFTHVDKALFADVLNKRGYLIYMSLSNRPVGCIWVNYDYGYTIVIYKMGINEWYDLVQP